MSDFLKQFSEQTGVQTQLNPEVQAPGLSVDDLSSDENYPTIAKYMDDRFGMTEERYSREDIVKSYVNNMRKFSFGQSVVTGQELAYLYSGEGEELENRRASANQAYELFDSLDNVFEGDNTVGQKADAVRDYARALIIDPVNIVSLGVGKLVSAGATKATARGVQEVARRAAVAEGKRVAARGVTGTARRQAEREAYRRALAHSMKEAGSSRAAREVVTREVLGTGAFDVTANVTLDAGTQKARTLAGVQEGYDPVQGAVAAAGGAVGAGLAGFLNFTRGTSGLDSASLSIARSDELLEEAAKRLSDPEEAAKVVSPEKTQEAVARILTPFKEYVARGKAIRDQMNDEGWEMYQRQGALAFNHGVRDILVEAGVPIRVINKAKGERRSGWIADVVTSKNLPEGVKENLQTLLDETVNSMTGKSTKVEDYVVANTDMASEAGRLLQSLSMTKEIAGILGKKVDDVTVEETLEATLNPVSAREYIGSTAATVQQNFIRMLVTHPGTTALNVVGWGAASLNQSAGDMIRGALYGGRSVLSTLIGDQPNAVKFRNQAKNMVTLQGQKLKNLVDPYSTYDEAMDYMTYRPRVQEKMFRYLAGGVESNDLVEELQMIAGEKMNRTTFQKVQNTLETAYGVKAQDLITKTQEFMYSLDKQMRLKTGMTYNEFMGQDNIADIMRNKDFKELAEIEAVAVDDALRNVFAKKYGSQHKGPLAYVAGIIEDARKFPVIGAMVPFGQFFNNTLGFMFDHTGVSLAHKIAFKTSRDPMELVTKAAVGWSLIGAATVSSIQDLEDGLAWHEERTNDGDVRTRLYDYPLSFFKMAGRIGAHIHRDGKIPQELLDEAFKTFGPDAVARQLGDAGSAMLEAIDMLASGEVEDAKSAAVNALKSSMAMYVSGMTRAADPVNTLLALAEGEDYVNPNRNIGNKQYNNAIRYTDRIIDSLLGLDSVEEAGDKVGLDLDASGYSERKDFAVTDRTQGVAVGRIFGYRSVDPSSTIQKMFRDVGKPDWQTELRISDPAALNTWNDYIFPILEMYTDQVMNTGDWDSLPLTRKQGVLKSLLSKARGDVKELLTNSTDADATQASLIYDINNQRSKGARVYREVLRDFNITERTLSELEEPQLRLLLFFLEERFSTEKEGIEDIVE